MLKRIMHWWVWHGFTIMRRSTLFAKMTAIQMSTSKIDAESAWTAIHPVISSLNELEKNTWDVIRVQNIKKWLVDNFEFEQS